MHRASPAFPECSERAANGLVQVIATATPTERNDRSRHYLYDFCGRIFFVHFAQPPSQFDRIFSATDHGRYREYFNLGLSGIWNNWKILKALASGFGLCDPTDLILFLKIA